jgi:hypothetical protein
MIPGVRSKDAAIIALIFREVLTKGDVSEADWRRLYALARSKLPFRKWKANIRSEFAAYVDFLLRTEFPAGRFLD